MSRFEGQTTLITGAASGIGAACVQRLHSEGSNVVALDISEVALQKLAVEFGGSSRVHTAVLDVTNNDQAASVIHDICRRFDDVHGLVNCAGVRGIGTLLSHSPEQWDQVMAVNLKGTFNTCQAFAQAMTNANRPGAIVNVSSVAGIRAVANRMAYVAAKTGVSAITQAMALELGPAGIRVNAIAPGFTRTAMTAVNFEDQQFIKRVEAQYPLCRTGKPEEMAAAIAFLLSEDASFITGVILPVDGGNTAGKPSY